MARPLSKDQADIAIRRSVFVNYLVDALTSPNCPLDSDLAAHLRTVAMFFDGFDFADKIDRVYDSNPLLREAVILGAIIILLDRLLESREPEWRPKRVVNAIAERTAALTQARTDPQCVDVRL